MEEMNERAARCEALQEKVKQVREVKHSALKQLRFNVACRLHAYEWRMVEEIREIRLYLAKFRGQSGQGGLSG